jgi:hypothetical protein
MVPLHITSMMNWVIPGFIGLLFGFISAWATHRFQKERDSIAWEREKAKLREQFEYEKRLIEIQFEQRLIEYVRQSEQQQRNRIREEILKGVDNPQQALDALLKGEREIADIERKREIQISKRLRSEYFTRGLRKYLGIGLIILVVVVGIVAMIFLVPH